MKTYLAFVIFLFSAEAFSSTVNIKPQSQDLKLTLDSASQKLVSTSLINRQFKVTPAGFIVSDDFFMFYHNSKPGKVPTTSTLKVKYTQETSLTPQFKWISTRLIEKANVTRTSQFNVNNKELLVYFQEDKKPVKSKKIAYKENVLPISAMPYYLFYQGRNKIGIPTNLTVFSEQNQSVQKIAWVYLGTSLENKKRIHRFEIKGELSQIIHLDMDGRILKIKDLSGHYVISSIQ